MPQKPLKAAKKIQKPSGNMHGKAPKMKKGKFDIKPKKATLVAKYKDERDLTKAINANNESNLASKAQQAGGHLAVIKAPVLAPADQKQKAKSTAKSSGKAAPGGS